MDANNQHIDPAELLVKYITGEASEEEISLVEKWISARAENKRYYGYFKQIWDESLKLVATDPVDEDKAWERFRNRIYSEYTDTGITVKHYLWLKVAAVVLVAAAAVAFLPGLFNHKEEARFASATNAAKQQSNKSRQTPANVISVTTNQVKTDTLPDGSTVTLNKNAMLSRPANFAAKIRRVELTGEAFFNIKHDPQRPFIVNVNNVKITVLGTSFNVKGNGNITEVVVETGLVNVQTAQQTVTLHPGQKLTANQAVMRCKVAPVSDTSYRNYFDVKVKRPVHDPVKLLKHDLVKHDQTVVDSIR